MLEYLCASRLAREAGLEYVEIQNLTEFYDDNRYLTLHYCVFFIVSSAFLYMHCWFLLFPLQRTQFAGMIMNAGLNLVDPRGRLLPRSYDVLGVAFNLFSQKLRLNFLCHHFIHTFSPFWHFHSAGLYTTFIFQKPDPDVAPPLTTPLLQHDGYTIDEASIYDFSEGYIERIFMQCSINDIFHVI